MLMKVLLLVYLCAHVHVCLTLSLKSVEPLVLLIASVMVFFLCRWLVVCVLKLHASSSLIRPSIPWLNFEGDLLLREDLLLFCIVQFEVE